MSTASSNPLIPSWSEADRLHALGSYEILDTPAEEEYDEIARLAAEVFDAPIALMSLVAEDRQWFKAKVGVDLTETPLSSSICKHTMLEPRMLVVPDTLKDARFADNPFVKGEPNVRFYAGVPLRSPEGLPIGTICVLDSQPRECSSKESRLLESLSRQIMVQLELRRSLKMKTRTETYLRSKLEELSFMDLAQDAIVLRDVDGKILFWNHGAERIYGWLRQEVVGRDYRDVLQADPAKFEQAAQSALQQGTWSGELGLQTKERRAITTESRWTLIDNANGQRKSILSISADITERKRIESHFMRAQRMESLGTLAGGIAHDLNNILAPIMMSIDLLSAEATTPDGQQILRTLQTSAKRGADIVRQVLSFASGLEGERLEVQPRKLFSELEGIIRNTFPKDIQLVFALPADIWAIHGDPTQIHQILLNLCVNARDAMPHGGSLSITAENIVLDDSFLVRHPEAKPGSHVGIRVADTGTGIGPDVLAKIFDPFFTTKPAAQGTGLGLSTVMTIVKSHHGVVSVASEVGQGSTFTVLLPAVEQADEVTAPRSEEALPRGKGETILVVDDEESILAITGQTLEAFGYAVLTAIDGADAVSVYAQNRQKIALVITDMMMPVMDGPSTVYALKRIDPAVRIIGASGFDTKAYPSKNADATVQHFLTKPYTAGTLLRAVRGTLDA